MSTLDWLVLSGTLLFIVVYGVWKTRGSKDMKGYLLGGKEAKWWTIGLSVMATQASAITFLSTPGQAYTDGMRFVQFYFGLPLAMVIICIVFIPIYHKLKVYTAYQFLENRFDLKTRQLSAFLFLVQRGLAAGITIYAPAIILTSILGWNLRLTCLAIGILVIIYTVSGGTKAVNQTQKLQMVVIMGGMFIAFYMLLDFLPNNMSFSEAMTIAGASGKLNVVDFSFDWNSRYTFWSGITGGLFLSLSYFGTDQSQVQRYLSGKSVRESRLGLIFNGLLKVPMQFFILLVGVMVFVFYQFNQPPVFFNQAEVKSVYASNSEYASQFQDFEKQHALIFKSKQAYNAQLLESVRQNDELGEAASRENIVKIDKKMHELRGEVQSLLKKANPEAETNDKDYVFITFILNHLPKGLIGLLLAVMFSAAMSSTSSEINALASTTVVDFYKRSFKPEASEAHYLKASKLLTLAWGLIAILFATYCNLFENLIQLVNIIGSIFYGTILGIFLVAFFVKFVKGNAVFIAALISQSIVLACYFTTDIGYLWFNVIGCMGVILTSMVIQSVLKK